MHDINTADRLSRPIFFIGMPRSGTTVIFEAFAVHKQLGWVSNYSSRFPRLPILNYVLRLAENRIWSFRGSKQQYGKASLSNRILPKPQEGYPFWETYCGEKFLWDFCLEPRANQQEAQALRSVLDKTLKYQGRSRLATKLTGPPRISYLRSIFPDAMFVHVVRDGRAVVDSLLRVDFWREKGGFDGPFWNGALSDSDISEWETYDRSALAIASIEWRNVITGIRDEAATLGPGDYHEIKYEDYIADTAESISRLYTGCGLNASFSHKLHPQLSNMNEKYMERSPDEIKCMQDIMGSYLLELGY